jgi:DNA-binding NarL/FixJ family response regulator
MTTTCSGTQEARRKVLTMHRRNRPATLRSVERQLNVLVADDHPEFRATLKELLEARGWADNVWEAENGEEAILGASVLCPDMIVMDLAMPRLDGLEATRLIKARQPEIFVVVCSVHSDPVYRRSAMANGADAFLPKASFPPWIDFMQRLTRETRS